MPFCSNCGSQVDAGKQFCSNCGAKIGLQTKASPPPTSVETTTATPPFTLNQLVFAALGLMGLDAIFSLGTANPIGVGQNLVFIGVLYYYVYKKLQANERTSAKTVLLYVGILYGLVSLVGVSVNGFGVWIFFEFPAAVLCLYGWSQITITKAPS